MSIAHVRASAPPPEWAPSPEPGITARRAYVVSGIALIAALLVPVPDERYWWARSAVALATYTAGVLPVWLHTRLRPWLRPWLRD